jgi:hypothetical protein
VQVSQCMNVEWTGEAQIRRGKGSFLASALPPDHFWAHVAFYLMRAVLWFPRIMRPCVKLTTRLRLMSKLRTSPAPTFTFPYVLAVRRDTRQHIRLRYWTAPTPSLSPFIIYLNREVGRSSPSSLTLLLCLQAPQDRRGVSKQYGEDTMIHRPFN